MRSYVDHPETAQLLQSIIDESGKAGLFLVPVGELEDWVSKLMSDGPSPTKRKGEWASEAARRIRRSPEEAGDIIGFVRRVGEFELAAAERLLAD